MRNLNVIVNILFLLSWICAVVYCVATHEPVYTIWIDAFGIGISVVGLLLSGLNSE